MEAIVISGRKEKYEKDVERLISIVSGSDAVIMARNKGSLIYKLEAEEIEINDLEAMA